MKVLVFSILAGTLLSVQGWGQAANQPHAGQERNGFATNLFFSKGGIGIVNTSLYIYVKSAKNELLLKDGARWRVLQAAGQRPR